jgi:hypothetical protein
MFVHQVAVRRAALALVAAGANDCEISRRLGIPRSTVRDWRRPTYVPETRDACWRCWRAIRPVRFEPADYAELLGLYLGDGHICALPRTERLRIFLDARHALAVDEAEALLRRCFPGNHVGRLVRTSMVVLWVYHGHLACLFPQHGPGKKHERPIILEPWQETLVDAAPWAFLRGCIRSDGCTFVNRTGKYEYLSYEFTNLSPDIRALFVRACARTGVQTRGYGKRIRICQRPSVRLMVEHVGIKS